MKRAKWNKEELILEAKKYKSRGAFAQGSNGAYDSARKSGVLDEICSHMEILWEKKWDQKTILKEAKKYKYYSDFTKQSPSAYGAATRLGIIEKLHKVLLPQPEKWTFKNVKDEAKKYKHRVDFIKGNESAYQKARKEGWLDKVCSHMTILYNGYFHCVYVIKNERLKKAYIGITSQRFNERIVQHKKKNNPTKSKSISNLKDTEYEMLTDYIFTSEEIKKSIEMQYIEIMQKKGFEILNNLSSVGGVGYSKRKWTKVLCAKEAIKYSTRWEFQKKSTNAYAAAKRHKYLDEICSHMDSPIKGQNNYWTKERCIEEVSKYKTKKDLSRGASYVYKKVLQNNWNDIFKHLQEPYIDSERDELGRYKKGISRKH